MLRSISATIVATQILWLRRDAETTPMHILKMAYLAHGWMLGICEEPLIYEPVEAWRHGPVVPILYQKYKSFRGEPISVVPVDMSSSFNDDQKGITEFINRAYRDYTALELSSITHESGSPWDIVRQTSGIGSIIPNEVIQNYYRNIAKKTVKTNG